MEIKKETRITLTHAEIKQLVIDFVRSQGYNFDSIEFNMSEYIDYGVKKLQLDGCTILCANKEK